MNLTALYARGTALAADAIDTSGTTVTFSRDPDLTTGVTVDKATLAVSDATPAVDVLVDEPAILVATGTVDVEEGPGRIRTRTVYRILLRPSATAIRKNDVGTVTAAQDTALIATKVLVTSAAPDPSGAFHDVRAVSQ